MTTTFVVVGSVRQWCGHVHRSRGAAERCADRDQRDCTSLPGHAYSDRRVYRAAELPRTLLGDYYLPALPARFLPREAT